MTIHRIRICKCGHEESLHGQHGCSYGLTSVHGRCNCERFRSRKVLGKKRAAPTGPPQATLYSALKSAAEFLNLALSILDSEEKEKEKVRAIQKLAASRETKARETKPLPRETIGRLGSSIDGPKKLGKGVRITLIAVAQHRNGVTRNQLVTLTGHRRSTCDTYFQHLRSAGFVEIVDNHILVTAKGERELGNDFQPLPTGRELRAHWISKLPKGESLIFKLLADVYPRGLSNEVLSSSTGFTRSTLDTYVQKLISRKLASKSNGLVCASKELYA